MNKQLKSYIDNLIRDHHDYQINVKHDIDPKEQEDILDFVFNHDEVLRELVINHIQELIDERSSFVESEDNYEKGLKPLHNSQTGETFWMRR